MNSNHWGNATKIVVTTILITLLIVLLITFRVMIPPKRRHSCNHIYNNTFVIGTNASTLYLSRHRTCQLATNLARSAIAREVTTRILTIIYVLVLNFWILKDFYKLQRFFFEQIPTSYQEDVRRLAQQLGNVWHSFLRGQLVLGLVVGSITWVALTIAGMPNAGGLALLAGIMEFLPTVGPGFSATIGVALSFFSQSTWLPLEGFSFFLLILTIYCIIAQFETIHLIPRLVGGRVKLHPAVAFMGIINGAIVFGLLGVLLATPVLGSARVLLSYLYRKLLDEEPFEPIPTPPTTVRMSGSIAGRKIEAIIFDLDGTLAELDHTFIHGFTHRFRWLDRVLSESQRESMAQSMMIALEGPTHFLISQLRYFESYRTLDSLRTTLNSIRGYTIPKEMQSFPDISDILFELSTKYQLAIVSTRRRTTVEKFLENAQLDADLFQIIITQEDVRNLMPHSEGLLVVLWGLGQREHLSDADLLLEYPAELCEWI